MASKPTDLIYGVDDVPPLPRLIALGFQYAIMISVYLILVLLVARAAKLSTSETAGLISLALIACAVATALQAWRGRFFGSGYLVPSAYSAIYFGPAILAAKAGGIPAVAGMTVFAGLIEILLSRLLEPFRVVFQPIIAGLAVFVVGLQLGLVGVSEAFDVDGELQPGFADAVGVALVTLAACIGFSIWGRGILRLVSTLLGLALGVVVAMLAGLIGAPTFDAVGAAPWLSLPDPSYLSFGFEPALIPAFIASAIAATLRTVGVVTTAQRINDADWRRPDMANISRGIVGDGLGCLVAGLVGAPGQSGAPSLVGLSSATSATSRAIAFAAALFLVAFAFLPKFGAAIIGLPPGIAGGMLMFTASFLVVSGIEVMFTRGIDLRGGFAVSVALFVGLLTQAKPEYFEHLPAWIQTITSDMLTVSLATAILLTLIFRIGIHRRGSADWQATRDAHAELARFLATEGKAWKLRDDVIGRASDTAARVVDDLDHDGYLASPVAMEANYDTLELAVTLVYRGRPPPVPHHHTPFHPLHHQETAASSGLATFLLDAGADRTSVTTRDDNVTIRLGFSA